jgi:aspartate ammonia-lyase
MVRHNFHPHPPEDELSATREETDALGSVLVPAEALYGAATARALGNSGVSTVLLRDRPELLLGMAWTKAAAASANAELGTIPADAGEAIIAAAREVAAGRWHEHFPLPILQGGGGTAANMNVNEVLANRATQIVRERSADIPRVHPLDHVNRSQSTNDVYPTALNLATVGLGNDAAAGFSHLIRTCIEQADRIPAGMERLGRTCLQDALPVPVAATHRMHAHALTRCHGDLVASLEPLHAVPLGATAVGTGFGAPPGYRELALAALVTESGIELSSVADPFDALAQADPLLAVMQALCRAAVVMAKIAHDFRFLSSGPIGGIGEMILPAVQVGSSAMPGKINPVVPELIIQLSHRVRGATVAVEAAVADGELELNVMTPVVALELLGTLGEVGRAARLFADRCVAGLAWSSDRIARNLRGSLTDAVVLAEESGYATSSARFPPAYPPLGT